MQVDLYGSDYYKSLFSYTKTKFETEKLLGQFFTHELVAESMVRDLLTKAVQSGKNVSVIDPFCGDGRLVVLLLNQLSLNHSTGVTKITIWDIDNANVEIAKRNILEAAAQLNLNVQLCAEAVDSFCEYKKHASCFDICVTNPPWVILKPQKTFSAQHSKEAQEAFNATLYLYDCYMRSEFYLSQPTSRFSKWGTNLARCGTEVALKLVKPSGFCSIVSPASLLSDQVSVKFREWIFTHYELLSIDYYVAEAKLYGSADVSSVALLFQRGTGSRAIHLRKFDANLGILEGKISKPAFEYIKRKGYVFPLATGIENIPILSRLEHLPKLGETPGIKLTRELDETRVKEKLVSCGEFLFIKGFMVDRYSYNIEQKQYANPSRCTVPQTCDHARIVWRDVSRNSQPRRVKACIIPPKTVAGNSLGVMYLTVDDPSRLKYLLAIVNSAVFEFQVRSLLVTNHVSSGVMKGVHVPIFDKAIMEKISSLVDLRMQGDTEVEPHIEALVAFNYGLSIDDYYTVISNYCESQIGEYKTIAKKIYNNLLS